jgi:hypothetical protein
VIKRRKKAHDVLSQKLPQKAGRNTFVSATFETRRFSHRCSVSAAALAMVIFYLPNPISGAGRVAPCTV